MFLINKKTIKTIIKFFKKMYVHSELFKCLRILKSVELSEFNNFGYLLKK